MNGREKRKEHYRCWINEAERILSFHYVEGYELYEFDNKDAFQNFYCRAVNWGYKVQ